MQQTRSNNFYFADQFEAQKPNHIYIPEPPIGNKVHLIMQRGLFVLERGPCVWLGMSITHAGSGGVTVFDGVPPDSGFFADPPEPPLLLDQDCNPIKQWRENKYTRISDDKGNWLELEDAKERWLEYARALGSYNGRRVSHAHPASMGMHLFSSGMRHGLTVLAQGEMSCTPTVMTFTWFVPKARQ